MNPSWNPASDLQAIDRAYRLGSRRDVNVYRLISAATMEEIVYSRQIYKQQQSNIAIEDAKDEPRYFNGPSPLPKNKTKGVRQAWLHFIYDPLRLQAECTHCKE